MSIFKRKTIKLELRAPVESAKSDVVIEPTPTSQPDRPSKNEHGQKSLWYPNSQIIDCGMRGAGKYRKGYPEGAIIHWSSGWSRQGDNKVSANKYAENTMKYGGKKGYGYFAISETGLVFQGQPLNEWDSHAGSSYWPSLGSDVSKYLVGIEVCCAGRLKKVSDGIYESWFGAKFNDSEVRYSAKKDNIQAGYYHKYSMAQEQALVDLLLWLKTNNPDVFNLDLVLGHDSVSPGRKSDPGGSLGMSIPAFSAYLKERYKQLT